MAFLQAHNIAKSFVSGSAGPGWLPSRRVRPVLEQVSLSVERGEFVSIVGFMGCGKSTLLNILSGVTRADSGEIRIDGQPVTGVNDCASIVFQNYSLLPWFSAYENVRLAVHAARPDWSRVDERRQAERYLSLVGLGNAMHRRPNQLSGGMRQRVAIARAFATEPELLFLDDPFGALDALTRGHLQQELARLCSPSGPERPGAEREGGRPVTTVMISNNLDEALLLSDRIIPMTPGPRATLGTPVAVDLPRPRSADALQHDRDAVRARMHVIESLTEHVHAAHQRRAKARSRGARAASAFVPADSREADV